MVKVMGCECVQYSIWLFIKGCYIIISLNEQRSLFSRLVSVTLLTEKTSVTHPCHILRY